MNALNNAKTSAILDIIFEGGESLNHPGKACDYMIVRGKRQALYAERLVDDRWDASDEYDHYEDLLADIIAQAEEEGIAFNKVKVNGKTIRIKATFNVPRTYADYFDDADVYADSVSELEDKLAKKQDSADKSMHDAMLSKELASKDYDIAPTYASIAQTEWICESDETAETKKTVYVVRTFCQKYTAKEARKIARMNMRTNISDVFDFDSDDLTETLTFDTLKKAIAVFEPKMKYYIDKSSESEYLHVWIDTVEERIDDEFQEILEMSEFGMLTYDDNGKMTVVHKN